MVKIISLIGSRAKKSNTVYLTNIVVDNLRKANPTEEFEHELLQPEQWNLLPCLSCNNCFHKGYCVNDNNDGMTILKEKLLAARIIIFGSPVFAQNVSGDTKHLIDRLSMWLHIMPLIGKYGIVLSTTDNNSGECVADYLSDMMEHMGLQVVIQFNSFVQVGDPIITDRNRIDKLMYKPILELSNALFKGIRPPISEKLQTIYMSNSRRFAYIKELSINNPALINAEQQLWERQGYQPYETIESLIEELEMSAYISE